MRLFVAILSQFGPAKPLLDSVGKLQLPPGTVSMHSIVSGDFIPGQRELLFAQALDWGADFILTLDDDVVPAPDALLRLSDVARNDAAVGVIAALTYTRESLAPGASEDWDPNVNTPVAVKSVGFGCALIRASIVRAMRAPYFSAQAEFDRTMNRVTLRDDSERFCERVRSAGYNVVLDPAVRVGRFNRATNAVDTAPAQRNVQPKRALQTTNVNYGEPAPGFDVPAIDFTKRTIYLHIGIHKTGTTSLQTFVTANAPALATRGIHVPYMGRPVNFFKSPYVGHHNVAWELNGYTQFQGGDGGLAQLADEISRVKAPTVVLSSEDFEFLHTKPQQVVKLAETLTGLGYTVKVVLDLRAQHDYTLAIYNEHSKAGHGINPRTYFEEVVATGAYHPKGAVDVYTGVNRFAYLPLIQVFADAFGSGNMIVRAYKSGRHPDDLLQDFLALIGAYGIPFASLAKPGELNISPSFASVLNGIYTGVKSRKAEAPTIEQLVTDRGVTADIPIFNRRFDIITEAELQALLQRFGHENMEIERLYGAQIPFRSERDLRARDASAWESVRKQRDLLDYAIERWQIS